MKRRHFIRSSGMALAGLSFASAASVLAANNRINVAVIGTGIRGQQLLKILTELPAFRLAAYCDVLPFRLDKTRSIAGDGARGYADYRRILDDPGIDAVVIATHFSAHYPIVLDALSAGKHVYCEKSMVKGIRETLKVAKAVRTSSSVFQTGFQYRCSPLYAAAARLIANGDLGDIAAINCQWNRNGDWRRPVPDPKWERQINWRMYREYSSGLVAELSAHQMDFCDWALQSAPTSVQGVGGIDYWQDGRETYDNTHVVCRYGNGVTATFTSLTTNSLGGFHISVLGSKGSLQLSMSEGWFSPEVAASPKPTDVDLISGASVSLGPQGGYRSSDMRAGYRIDAAGEEPTAKALVEFANAINDRRQPVSNIVNGVRSSIMVQMAIDAMDTGKVKRWKETYNLSA